LPDSLLAPAPPRNRLVHHPATRTQVACGIEKSVPQLSRRGGMGVESRGVCLTARDCQGGSTCLFCQNEHNIPTPGGFSRGAFQACFPCRALIAVGSAGGPRTSGAGRQSNWPKALPTDWRGRKRQNGLPPQPVVFTL